MIDRTVQPEINLDTNFDFIKPNEFKIRNSIPCYWIEDHYNESYKIELVFNSGTRFQQKKLVSSFMNNLLLSGTNSMNSSQISERIDFYGGYIKIDTDKDHSIVSVFGLKKNIVKILSFVLHNINNCKFPMNEIENYRMISSEKFKQNQEKVSHLARRKFTESLFGKNTSYCQVPDFEDYANVKESDIIDLFSSNIIYGLKGIFIVGAMDKNLMKELEGIPFYAYKDKKLDFSFEGKDGQTEKISKKGALQSAIRLGNICMDKNHEDFIGFSILNTLFGGYFGSRLMSNIREDKGYTYGIGSGIVPLQEKTYFFISTEVKAEVYEDTLKEIKKEIDILHQEKIDAGELFKVKNYLKGKFIQGSDGPFAMMERFKSLWFHGLDYSYYDKYLQTVDQITADDLQKIAQNHLQFDKMNKIIAGLPDN
ncbi:MAG: insulinase family protein [Crocinitomicaceae bacterium]|nr:insulinase family protein [Crocinitomicaceae bacterium]